MAIRYGNLTHQQKDGIEHPAAGIVDAIRGALPPPREKRPMKLEEKADALSSKAMLVLAGYILCAAVNHVHDLWSQHGQLQVIQSQVVPKLKAQAAQVPVLKKKVGCEHWRADVSAQVAKDAIRGANSDSAPIPAPTAIPADNCQDSARK